MRILHIPVLWLALGWAVLSSLACRTTKSVESSTPAAAGLQAKEIDAVAKVIAAQSRPTRSPGIPGDVVNLAFVGERGELNAAFTKAGWVQPEPRSVRNDVRLALAVVFDRPYPAAPISDLYLFGRPQDLAFERETKGSPKSRHHLRLWLVPGTTVSGRSLWLGAATYDTKVAISLVGGPHLTHDVAPDIDVERGYIISAMENLGVAAGGIPFPGVGPTEDLRNGDGGRLTTDGKAVLVVLRGIESHPLPTAAQPSAAQPEGPPKRNLVTEFAEFGELTDHELFVAKCAVELRLKGNATMFLEQAIAICGPLVR